MAIITTNVGLDMTSFDVSDLKTASVVRTDTIVTATGALYTYTFTGTGFGTGSGLPSSGTVTGLSIDGGGTHITITGANVSVQTIGLILLFGGDFLDVEGALLGTNDTFNASNAADFLIGFEGNDTFNMAGGGDDHVMGLQGNDTFNFGARLSAADIVDGGNETDASAGHDKVVLKGDYSGGVTFNATTMIGVETLNLTGKNSYKLVTDNATVATGKTLIVSGIGVDSGHKVNFDGSAETDGSFRIKGGAGADTLIGGAKGDWFTGGLGADKLTGGNGGDHFIYTAVAESTGTKYDTIAGFDFDHDLIDLTFAVSAIDAARSGALSTASFNVDMSAILGAAQLGNHHAALVTGAGGGLNGHVFLVIDANGTAGYQANQDFVIELNAPVHATHISTADFI